MQMQDNFPEFHPQNAEVITNYEGPLPISEIASALIDLENNNMPNQEKIPIFAQSIESLRLILEQTLYNTERYNSGVSIQTLPHHSGNDHELISVIQPTAWISADEGSYYDPIEQRTMHNLVGYWDGASPSLQSHILKLLFKNGCFISYHVTALFSLILALIMKFVLGPNLTMILLIAVAFGYDIIAMLFIIFSETFSQDLGNPRLANQIQREVKAAIHGILAQLSISIDTKLFSLSLNSSNQGSQVSENNSKQTVSQKSGWFLLTYFYQPALKILSDELRNSSTALFNKKNASTLDWSTVENLLIIYRFVREISQSNPPESEQMDRSVSMNLRILLIELIKVGNETVHLQLLRLLYKSSISPIDRSGIIIQNPRDLSLNHYIGAAECETIKIELQKAYNISSRSQRLSASQAMRYKNIGDSLGVNKTTSSISPSIMPHFSTPAKI